ncbi:DNA topoisomerase IB [Ponticoccus alexandrii]|uniref:DNA topoisomerase n=1 Tax=Ponticoccus alexandrii TaxID=1943633 RepID=A0ABX7FDI4_9RHOB|nr:DNA topoisomerase [Ponticoccus alexandrii]QRF67644.1 DNA topoisomerase IB [Ponticoccus alexandrii]
MNAAPRLTFYPDSRPGIRRERRGRGFSYIAPDGTRIDAAAERARIAALAVPPAYENVWICPRDDGHLQATGRDTRARKQYRYHPDWRAFREAQKYDQLACFGAALPALRRHIRRTLRQAEPGDQAFAIAAILALIDRASLRVGSPGYAKENRTFGATTLRHRHLTLDGDEIKLTYRAKGGLLVRKTLKDASLNRTLARLDDLPGPELASWIDEGGTARAVTAGEVNAFLAAQTGTEGLTAKSFRTWNGSAAALEIAVKEENLTIKAMTEAAAERLANTPAIARKSYIHPEVIALTETPWDDRRALLQAPAERGLRKAEAALLRLLEHGA